MPLGIYLKVSYVIPTPNFRYLAPPTKNGHRAPLNIVVSPRRM